MWLAQRGLRVVYEPAALVTHVRSGSGSSGAAIRLSERNRRRFVDRWSGRLTGRPSTFSHGGRQAMFAARDAPATPRVLICAPPEACGARELALALLDAWPPARVTWSTGPLGEFNIDGDVWLGRGIEIVDEDLSWLDDRLFHYDAVIIGSCCSQLALERTQPQAPLISLDELSGPADTRSAWWRPADPHILIVVSESALQRGVVVAGLLVEHVSDVGLR